MTSDRWNLSRWIFSMASPCGESGKGNTSLKGTDGFSPRNGQQQKKWEYLGNSAKTWPFWGWLYKWPSFHGCWWPPTGRKKGHSLNVPGKWRMFLSTGIFLQEKFCCKKNGRCDCFGGQNTPHTPQTKRKMFFAWATKKPCDLPISTGCLIGILIVASCKPGFFSLLTSSKKELLC